MNPAIFNQFTYTMLLVAVSVLLVYGLVRACVYIPDEWSWLASGAAEMAAAFPACAAIYQITGDFQVSSLVIIFFAVGMVPALAPRLYKFRQQRVESLAEEKRAEGVLDGIRKAKEQ